MWWLICKTDIRKSVFSKFNYNKGNYIRIAKEFDKVTWDNEFSNKNMNEMWHIFLKKMTRYRDEYIPVQRVAHKKSLMWMNKTINREIKKRNKVWSRYVKNVDFGKLTFYTKIRNKVNKLIRKNKIVVEEDLATKIKDDPKAFYAYVRSKGNTKATVGPLCDENGVITDDPLDIATILRKHFAQVFTREDVTSMPNVNPRKNRYQSDAVIEPLVDICITKEKSS